LLQAAGATFPGMTETKYTMREISIIELKWNGWNGFIFDLLVIETNSFEGSLLAVYASKNHFTFRILFYQFEVKSPFI
jgi:hypothetical protein